MKKVLQIGILAGSMGLWLTAHGQEPGSSQDPNRTGIDPNAGIPLTSQDANRIGIKNEPIGTQFPGTAASPGAFPSQQPGIIPSIIALPTASPTP